MSRSRTASITALAAGIIMFSLWSVGAASPPQHAGLLQAGQCYRIAFTIDGAPNYKVLEVLEGGWLKAEVEAGTARAQRQPLWINTAQIVTFRPVECSA